MSYRAFVGVAAFAAEHNRAPSVVVVDAVGAVGGRLRIEVEIGDERIQIA